ncbi:hypothetical protein ScPMuIL_010149 [Solemya velum]
MASVCDLNVAKKNLSDALGDNMKIYLQNLKSWFKQKISKEDFDLEARKLLQSDAVSLHNEFLLAIIVKCQSLSGSLVPKETSGSSQTLSQVKRLKYAKVMKKKSQVARSNFQQRFVPAPPLDYAPEAMYRGSEELVFACRELTLPDVFMVHGRMLVSAWEFGLEDVADGAVKIVMQSVEYQLKQIISLVLALRGGYQLREKKFRFAMGSEVTSPYLRHSSTAQDSRQESEATTVIQTGNHIPNLHLPMDAGSAAAAEALATSSRPHTFKGPVNLSSLLQALQLYRSVIPSHSVYAPAVERIVHKLWHPSNEDLEQELIHEQEMSMKQEISQQAAVR